MFKLTVIDNKLFKDAFESIVKIVDEVICDIDNEGFHINAIDRAHITFVGLDLKFEIFDEFEVSEPTRISLDTEEMNTVLKRMKSNDILTLSNDDGNLIITLKGDADREFKIRLIDAEYDVPNPPQIDLKVNLDLPSNMVKDAIEDMSMYNDSLIFSADADYFRVNTSGNFGDADMKYLHGESVQEYVKSSFSIENLRNIFKASKFSKNVNLKLDTDKPLLLSFEVDNGNGSLNYMLAPRIENDDDD